MEREALSDLLLAPLPVSSSNRFADDEEAALLGQQLFFDARFSGPLTIGDNGRNGGLGEIGAVGLVSCATCHDPALGGSDYRSTGPTSVGAGFTSRSAQTVLNAAYIDWMFWDGRRDSVWSQALVPIESDVEHNSSRLHVARLLHEHYRAPYEALFGPLPDFSDESRFFDTMREDDPQRTRKGKPGDEVWDAMSEVDRDAVNLAFANFGKAIEAYERKLVDETSPFDRFMAGDAEAMSDSAVRGAKLFVGRASCNECHSGPALADGTFRNHGVPQTGSDVPAEDLGRAAAVSLVLADTFNAAGPFSDDREAGATRLTGLQVQRSDLGAFKVPTLRNVTRTAPYMHTGAFATLWDVMEWYRLAAGTDRFSGERDAAAVAPLALSDQDINDLVAFLAALEGDPLPDEITQAPELP